MKAIKFLLPILLLGIVLSSCENEVKGPDSKNETANLKKVTSFTKNQYSIDLFTTNGKLQTGYNKIYLQIKDPNAQLVQNAKLSWVPMMHMSNMSHACPYSEIQKMPDTESLYEGYIIFTMPSGDMGSWEIRINITINDENHEFVENIIVDPSEWRTINSFTGTDSQRYVIALIEPEHPKVAINDMKVGLYKMANMTSFPVAENYFIRIDPRMPSMGNHGSPNNQDLTWQNDGFYHGKLSLSMTGLWVINLIVEDTENQIIKGEQVTEDIEKSSLYFEIKF